MIRDPAKALPIDMMTKEWGNAAAALATAPVRIEQEYRTPREYNVPIEPHGLIAHWEGDMLTLWEPSQWIDGMSRTYAEWFGIPFENVRMLSPYIGGGFGSKALPTRYGAVAAIAAKMLDRPVKLAVARPQTFTAFGGRPETRQKLALGATPGRQTPVGRPSRGERDFGGCVSVEPLGRGDVDRVCDAESVFASELVPVNTVMPGALRAPGETPAPSGSSAPSTSLLTR